MAEPISLWVAFVAGLVSFLSPCVLPLVPSYLSYVTGLSIEELTQAGQTSRSRTKVLSHCLVFILGFGIVFVLLGASATFLGQVLGQYQVWLQRVGGAAIFLFGLTMMGLIKIPWLTQEKRLKLSSRPVGYAGSFLMGVVFSLAWTPCVGPILGSILVYASTRESLFLGVKLLTAYSAGLAVPFLIAGVAFEKFLSASKRLRSHLGLIEKASGFLLALAGILIATGRFAQIAGELVRWFPKVNL